MKKKLNNENEMKMKIMKLKRKKKEKIVIKNLQIRIKSFLEKRDEKNVIKSFWKSK